MSMNEFNDLYEKYEWIDDQKAEKLLRIAKKTLSIENFPFYFFFDDAFDLKTENILDLIKSGISFVEVVRVIKDFSDQERGDTLAYLLDDEALFKRLFNQNLLDDSDIVCLLSEIDSYYSIDAVVFDNATLVNHILKTYVLATHTFENLTEILNDEETSYAWDPGCRFDDWKELNCEVQYPLFEFLKFASSRRRLCCEYDDSLIDLNEKLYTLNSFNFNKEQKLELAEILKNNEITKNKLIQIIDNHVESKYDFDSLMNYLKKKEKKNVLNI